MLEFTDHGATGSRTRGYEADHLVIAGWAARDQAAVQHHIDELAALGVPPPSQVPLFYRTSASLLTQAGRIEVLGPDTSGEAEPVVIAADDGLWLTVGSDHTDRKAETQGVALSKQLCSKPVARELWRLADVASHWDRLVMRSYAIIDGNRQPYQDGQLATLRTPDDLIARLTPDQKLAAGTVLFGGTLSAIGGIRPADRFEIELTDPVLGRSIRHGYDIAVLPVVT